MNMQVCKWKKKNLIVFLHIRCSLVKHIPPSVWMIINSGTLILSFLFILFYKFQLLFLKKIKDRVMLMKGNPFDCLFKWKHSGYLCSDKLPASLACYLSRDACAWCHLATAGIFKCPDEYIAPGSDCSNWTLSALLHAQHTLMGLLTVLCIHLTKKGKKKEKKKESHSSVPEGVRRCMDAELDAADTAVCTQTAQTPQVLTDLSPILLLFPEGRICTNWAVSAPGERASCVNEMPE